jgi:biotin transport system substrate-specific component
MEISTTIDKFSTARLHFFQWRFELGFAQKVLLALVLAGMTGLFAQLRFYIPGSPVPVTAQTCAVLLSAVVLGKWWGGISQSLYLAIGIIGLPWFADQSSGLGYVMGATGGYLVGFVIAAFVLGYLVDSRVKNRTFGALFGWMMLANFAIIYGCGLTYLYFWGLANGHAMDLIGLFIAGAMPFILGDLLKIGLASGVSAGITPKEAFGGETT